MKGQDVSPILSYDPDIEKDAIRAVKKGMD